jgi:hypothetical protein
MLNMEVKVGPIRSAGVVGLRVVGAAPASALNMTTRSYAAVNPAFRHRPSHDARGFRRHRTGWSDEIQVPMPFRRGIPFRGDALGDTLTVITAVSSPTG